MAERHTPHLWWDPGRLQRTRPMIEAGALDGAPFATFDAALQAADARRSAGGPGSPRDNVFVITWVPEGWMVYEYREERMGRADLDELKERSLPLGGSLTAPRTFLVDARGRLGRLMPGEAPGKYRIERVGREGQAPEPPPVYVPAYVPRSQENHGKNVSWEPVVSLRPDTDVEVLAAALGHLHATLPPDLRFKPGGWRHSWSPVAATDGVYVHPEWMRGVASVAPETLRDTVSTENLFEVYAGTRIREINEALWTAGRALPWLGGYDGQTLGGVLPTGTHGSVLRFGPLAEMVRSLDLVRYDGAVVRIEPAARPLTAPEAFEAAHPAWSLVQDDDVFHAALVSMGTMGVFHRLVIEAVPRFWLKEVRTATTMPAAQAVLRGGNLYRLAEVAARPAWIAPPDGRAFADHPKPAYHLELLWNPYTDRVVVTSRHPVDAARRAAFEQEEPAWFGQAPVRDLHRALKLDAMADDYSRPDVPELATEYLSGVLDEALEVVARLRPQLLPRFIDSSLASLPDPSYVQRSYKVFNIGQGANHIPAQSGTLSVPLRDDHWLDAIDVIRTTARRLADEARTYQTGPIALRFVRGSEILLADPEDVCKFEVIFGGDNNHVQALSRTVVKAYYDALYAVFGGDVRLHWGQLIPDGTLDLPGRTAHRVRESYPRYDVWRTIRDQFDPAGRGLNAWQERMLP